MIKPLANNRLFLEKAVIIHTELKTKAEEN